MVAEASRRPVTRAWRRSAMISRSRPMPRPRSMPRSRSRSERGNSPAPLAPAHSDPWSSNSNEKNALYTLPSRTHVSIGEYDIMMPTVQRSVKQGDPCEISVCWLSSRSDKNKKTSTPRIPTHERSIRSIGPIRSIRSIRRYSITAVKSSRRNQLNQRFRLVTFALPLFLAFYFSVRRGYHQLSVCTPQHAPGEGKYARGLGEFRILHNRTAGFPVRDCGHTHVAVVVYRRV